MNELTLYDPNSFEVMQRMAKAMVASGYFKDSGDVAQAFVKIQAGRELGIPPFASMTGINIIQGKPALGANLIATLVKNDPRYNYQVNFCDNEECNIDWFEHGEHIGNSTFTIEEAKAAGLAHKDNWKKYTSDMLFARALTRGARRFAPGIFGGSPVYTADELGADTDEDGNIVEGEITATRPGTVTPAEFMAEFDRDMGRKHDPGGDAPKQPTPKPNGKAADLTPPMPTDKMRREFHAIGTELYGDEWDDKRPELVRHICLKRPGFPEITSSNDLFRAEMQHLIDGMNDKLSERKAQEKAD